MLHHGRRDAAAEVFLGRVEPLLLDLPQAGGLFQDTARRWDFPAGRPDQMLPAVPDQVPQHLVIEYVLVRAEPGKAICGRLPVQRRRARTQEQPVFAMMLQVPVDEFALGQQDVAGRLAAEVLPRCHQPPGVDFGHRVLGPGRLVRLQPLAEHPQAPIRRRSPVAKAGLIAAGGETFLDDKTVDLAIQSGPNVDGRRGEAVAPPLVGPRFPTCHIMGKLPVVADMVSQADGSLGVHMVVALAGFARRAVRGLEDHQPGSQVDDADSRVVRFVANPGGPTGQRIPAVGRDETAPGRPRILRWFPVPRSMRRRRLGRSSHADRCGLRGSRRGWSSLSGSK